ncbi:MAG: phosphate acyltransferase [Candidatus Omnitrophota bacterium]
MDTISKVRRKSKSNPKTIILPESEDKRVREAARIIEKEGIAKIALLSRDMLNPDDKARYARQYYELRKYKGLTEEAAAKIFEDPLYYSAMMVKEGKADGLVAGASHTTPDVARSTIHCLGVEKRLGIACSCFIMAVPDCSYGENGTFVFADCGIVPEPNPRQLAAISVAASELARKVLDIIPRVAMLSYSTKGSAQGERIDKVRQALGIVKEMSPELLVDGELQVDAAIVPEISRIKYPGGLLGGEANVLIFPNLEAGNIAYKLVERLAKARALGPLILGLNKPCSDLSRGCSVEDIVDCVAVTSIRAQ